MTSMPPAQTSHRRGRARPPPEVQELLDALMFFQAQVGRVGAASCITDEGKQMLMLWFGGLPVEERVNTLQLQEPAFVKLLLLMAAKAQTASKRQGQQQFGQGLRRHQQRPSTAKFLVFPESVPALAASQRGGGGGGGIGKRRQQIAERSSSSSNHRKQDLSTLNLFEDEPFLLRPSDSRETAWGDPLRLAPNPEKVGAWEALMENLLILQERRGNGGSSGGADDSTYLGMFSLSLLEDTGGFFRLLEEASGRCFLSESLVDVGTSQELMGETAWFRSKGDYTIGELLANKVEVLLCRGWWKHQASPQQKTSTVARTTATTATPAASILTSYLEDRRTLEVFLFGNLAGRETRLQCLSSSMAKAIHGMLQEQHAPSSAAANAFASQRHQLELLLSTTHTPQPLSPRRRGGSESHSRAQTLDSLLSVPLSECSSSTSISFADQCRIRALLRAELMERRTLWCQQQLLQALDEEGPTKHRAATSATQATSSSKKKKKKRRNKAATSVAALSTTAESASRGGAGAGAAAGQDGVGREGQLEKPLSLLDEEEGRQQEEEEEEEEQKETAVADCTVSDDGQDAEDGDSIHVQHVNGEEEGLQGKMEVLKEVDPVDSPLTEAAADKEKDKEEEELEEEKGDGADEEEDEMVEISSSMTCEEDGSGSRSGQRPYDSCMEEGGVDDASKGMEGSETHTHTQAELGQQYCHHMSSEALLKDLCLKLEAEVATLRGVLAMQRGGFSHGSGSSNSNDNNTNSGVSAVNFPHYAAPGFHGGGGVMVPGYGYSHLPHRLHAHHHPHHHQQHLLMSRHGLHHMEIMSDDGRGGDGGGGGGSYWQGGVVQSSASPFRPPLSNSAANSVYSGEGSLPGDSGGASFAPVVPLPRNASGPLQAWAERPQAQQQQQQRQQQPQHQSSSASVSFGGDGPVVSPPSHSPSSQNHYQQQQHQHQQQQLHGQAMAQTTHQHHHHQHHHHSTEPDLPPSSSDFTNKKGVDVGATPSCSGFTLRRPLANIRSRLCDDIVNFVERVSTLTTSRQSQRTLAINRCRQVVQSLWPRAQVKAFGSFVSGLALPSSDVDLVICLPQVRKDTPAEAPGVLEGRNAIKETWQQELARRLRNTAWVNPGSIRIISHTTIPVIKLKIEPTAAMATTTRGPSPSPSPSPSSRAGPCAPVGFAAPSAGVANSSLPLPPPPPPSSLSVAEEEKDGVETFLDVSIEGTQHNGLLANRVIAELVQENPALRPLVLVLKHFMKERGLMESYSGGLSSYGLVLMVARYLQEQSTTMDTGSLLLGFLDFYSNHFDPRTMGISVNHRCYFSREQVQATPSLGPHRRVSLGGGGEMDYYIHPPAPHQHAASAAATSGANTATRPMPLLENPYKFDPLYIEDPICATNNIGRNCFRIFQIQRAWNDAWRDLDPGNAEGPPLLRRILHHQL